jgi:hypothetical protein
VNVISAPLCRTVRPLVGVRGKLATVSMPDAEWFREENTRAA